MMVQPAWGLLGLAPIIEVTGTKVHSRSLCPPNCAWVYLCIKLPLMSKIVNSGFIGVHTVKVVSAEPPGYKEFNALGNFEIGRIILEFLRFFKGLSECEWTLVIVVEG